MDTTRGTLMERGLPLSLSRHTDVAHHYMGWLRKRVEEYGYVPAPDPIEVVPRRWSLAPDDVHSLFFWTKWSEKLRKAASDWLQDYRIFVAYTITGWTEVETRVPPLEEQLEDFKRSVDFFGKDAMRWRFSPVPTDILKRATTSSRLFKIAHHVAAAGFDEFDVSLMQPSPHWDEGYSTDDVQSEEEARIKALGIVGDVASSHGLQVGLCADDLRFINRLDENVFFPTRCLDREKLDQLFDMNTEQRDEHGCPCQMSVDPCQGAQFGCASACEYCYVEFTNTPDRDNS